MFKQVMKKIGVIVLALTLLILDLTLLGAFPLLTQDGKFSLVEQIGYGVWALGSLAIFIVIAYRFKLLSLKEINWRRLVVIASLNLVIFFLGDLLGYFVGQLTHNATMENQDALNKIFIHVPFYLHLVVVALRRVLLFPVFSLWLVTQHLRFRQLSSMVLCQLVLR